MMLGPRALQGRGKKANGPESRHLGHAFCCNGTGFVLPHLKIPYKLLLQPLAEQYMEAKILLACCISPLCCGHHRLSDLCVND